MGILFAHARDEWNILKFGHSRPQSPRSLWPVAGIESSGRTRFSEYAQSIRFVFSTNQIWWEVRESRTSGVRPSQSSRSLPQARRIVGSGDENDVRRTRTSTVFPCRWLVGTWALILEIVSRDSVMVSSAHKTRADKLRCLMKKAVLL